MADLGGTEMEDALNSTFALAQVMPSDVLVVTDGEISAIDSTILSAKASGHRLFVVGIGSSPAESHLRRLAEETGGACDFVAPGEAVEPAVLRMFARLRSPRLTKLTVKWPDGAMPIWVSPLPASVFDGDTVNVFALLPQRPEGQTQLFGIRESGSEGEEIARAQFSPCMESGTTLSRLAMSARLNSFVSKKQSDEARRLAVAYQLVTDQTNFFLLHQRAEEEKPDDMPELHQVMQMLAAGWGGTGSVIKGTLFEDSHAHHDISCCTMAAPAVMLRSSSRTSQAFTNSGEDFLDIPAFLRRRDDIIDHANSRHWSASDDYKGLTPLGLSEWLRVTPQSEWPKTYLDMRRIGLGALVVDWLELSVTARDAKALPEQDVINSFFM